MHAIDRVCRGVDGLADELVAFAADLVRFPTANPPGAAYRACAEFLGDRLRTMGFRVEYVTATGRPEHTPEHPRVNVVGSLPGAAPRPLVHLNGHIDVVPPGAGWTLDPFGGVVREGRLYGRGSADMKAGLAAAVFAVEALRRAGVSLAGTVEVSGTVDEESGGLAGVAHLASTGRIASGRTDWVIIPEPFGTHRICLGHKGVYWFKVTSSGRPAHGSMPFLGVSAIEHLSVLLDRFRSDLIPALEARTTAMPVIPPEARRASLNLNAISGGQAGHAVQTPCVADHCEVICDRRFVMEESLEEVRDEIRRLVARVAAEDPARRFRVSDVLVVHPTQAPADSPLVRTLGDAIALVVGREAELVASPGTYDQKHVARIAGVPHCVAYGPGAVEQAHQADEWCRVEDIVTACKVLAVTLLRLVGPR